MEVFTLSDGTPIPSLGFGTYKMRTDVCVRMISIALETGYRHIDTAQAYENQKEIGRAICSVAREELYLTSKLWLGDHTKDRVPLACERILRELGVDYVDLLLIHWPDRSVPFAETLEAMQRLKEEGKVRTLGVSNFTERHLSDALDIGIPILVNQVECHVYFAQRALQSFCTRRGVALTAYAPLGKGEIASDPVLQEIGALYGKTGAQVAIRWLLDRECIAIPKSATPERIRENFAVFDFALTPKDRERIDAIDREERMVCPEVADFAYR